jgi:hypothetical protein
MLTHTKTIYDAGNRQLMGQAHLQASRQETDPMTEALQAMRGGGDDEDLLFYLFASRVRDLNDQVTQKIGQLEQTRQIRSAINQKLGLLRKVEDQLTKSTTTKGDNEGETNPAMSPNDMAVQIGGAYGQNAGLLVEHTSVKGATFRYDENVGVQQVGGQDLLNGDCEFTLESVRHGIKHLESELESMDSDRQIELIKVNQLLNKKSEATQMLSNMLKKDHDTRAALINNLR